MPVGKPQPINSMCEVFSDSVDLPCETERRKDKSASPAGSTGADQDGATVLKATNFRN